jgi:hypothetical protein
MATETADKLHYARKAGRCVSYSAALAGNAPECRRTIEVGDPYYDGELDPYSAGGFGHDRVCIACREKGYA